MKDIHAWYAAASRTDVWHAQGEPSELRIVAEAVCKNAHALPGYVVAVDQHTAGVDWAHIKELRAALASQGAPTAMREAELALLEDRYREGAPAPQPKENVMQVTDEMVSRFLAWRLPPTFSPDGGITFKPKLNEGMSFEHNYEPVGTNLFSAVEARAMLDHVLEAPAVLASQATSAVATPQGEMAWLIEWKAHGYGPQWWGFNHTPGRHSDWCADANNAIRFSRREDAERMRLHIIAVEGHTGNHAREQSITVTEHMWPATVAA